MTEHDAEAKSAWPYKTLLFLGFFGWDEPAGKRLVLQTHAAIAVTIVSIFMIRAETATFIPQFIWVAAIPLSILATVWAYVRYLRGLDELRQLIQLKAMAVAYACAIVLWSVAVVTKLAYDDRLLGTLVLMIALAEVARGIALAWFARHYD